MSTNENNRKESESELSFKSSSLAANDHLGILLKETKKISQATNDFVSRLLENQIDDSSPASCIESLHKAISDLGNDFMAVEKECELLKQKAIDLSRSSEKTKENAGIAKLIKKQFDDGLTNFKQTTLKNEKLCCMLEQRGFNDVER